MLRTAAARWATIAGILTVLIPWTASAQAGIPEADLLVLEWADQARDRNAIRGDPVFQRSLYCEGKQGPIDCDMVVVVLSRTNCPEEDRAVRVGLYVGHLRGGWRSDARCGIACVHPEYEGRGECS
jgi:hypothetical protein